MGRSSLNKGDNTMDILKKLKMEDCRTMSMPMITNWRKIDTSMYATVDLTLYRQLIGFFMYLVNTKPDICFAVNTLSQFMVESKRVHWTVMRRATISTRYIRLWFEIYLRRWCQIDGIHRCRLGR